MVNICGHLNVRRVVHATKSFMVWKVNPITWQLICSSKKVSEEQIHSIGYICRVMLKISKYIYYNFHNSSFFLTNLKTYFIKIQDILSISVHTSISTKYIKNAILRMFLCMQSIFRLQIGGRESLIFLWQKSLLKYDIFGTFKCFNCYKRFSVSAPLASTD